MIPKKSWSGRWTDVNDIAFVKKNNKRFLGNNDNDTTVVILMQVNAFCRTDCGSVLSFGAVLNDIDALRCRARFLKAILLF